MEFMPRATKLEKLLSNIHAVNLNDRDFFECEMQRPLKWRKICFRRRSFVAPLSVDRTLYPKLTRASNVFGDWVPAEVKR